MQEERISGPKRNEMFASDDKKKFCPSSAVDGGEAFESILSAYSGETADDLTWFPVAQ